MQYVMDVALILGLITLYTVGVMFAVSVLGATIAVLITFLSK